MLQLDIEKLKNVLLSFHKITGVRIGIADEWYNEIIAYPKEICPLCKRLRTYKTIDKKCRESDIVAYEIVSKTRQQYTYRCHMNLYESVYPIIVQNQIVGYLMIGQFIDNSNREKIRQKVYSYIEKNESIDKEIDSLTVLRNDLILPVAYIMSICAEYLCFYKIIEHKSEGMIKKIEEYVDMHLTEKITVKSLSEYLGVSRTTIYILIKKQYGKSIVEYINLKKMEKAKYLLSQGKTTSKVVEELGIYDSNYFFRLFKKFNGITLGEFKRQLHE